VLTTAVLAELIKVWISIAEEYVCNFWSGTLLANRA
jgi:hypothetical protein